MKKLKPMLVLSMLSAAFGLSAASGDVVTIPTPAGEYIDWNNAIMENCKVENNGGNVGSTGAGTKVVFNLQSATDGSYEVNISTGHKGTANLNLVITDAAGETVFTAVHQISNTGSWTPSVAGKFLTPQLPAGDYTLTMTPSDLEGSNYAGNWGNLALYDGNVDNTEHIPGVVTIAKASMVGGARNEGQNIGYIKDGCGSQNDITVDDAGVYSVTTEIARYGDGVATFTITDAITGALEAETKWTIPADQPGAYTPVTVNLEGNLNTGRKVFKLVFNASHGGFIANYKDFTFEKIAEQCAVFRGVEIEGKTVTAGDGYDWNCNLPVEFEDAATVIRPVANDAALITATAVDGDGNAVEVVKNSDGTFSVPTPAPSTETVVTFNVTATEGVLVFRESYTLRLYHIGDILLRSLTIDGVDAPSAMFEALNVPGESASYDLTDWVFTASPRIVAVFADGNSVVADGSIDGTDGVFTFTGVAGSKQKNYTVNISGFNIYTPDENDEFVKLVYDGSQVNNDVWSNGLYTIAPNGDGWGGKQFKFKNNTEITLTVPSNVIVKQLKFAQLKDNYKPGDVKYVKAGDATVYKPTAAHFGNGDGAEKDLLVNFDNFAAGTPVTFFFEEGSQPVAWFELYVQKESVTTAPVPVSTKMTPTANVNHSVVTLGFDREMKSGMATVNNTTVQGIVNGAEIRFNVWDLPFNETSVLTIPANGVEDVYGNKNAEPVAVSIVVGAPAEVPAFEPIVVTNVDEWKGALAAVAESNKTADAPRRMIFVRNGSYDFGSEEQNLGSTFNVSIVGESKEGVILHGNRTGISNPIISTRKATGTYFQDLTIRNDLDFGQETRVGVGVAFYGGTRDVLVNVALQSIQDTYVTGNQSYMLNCDIHGMVDYICGGGNHYFDHCTIHHDYAEGGYVTAPSTSANDKYGYVFGDCTIDGYGNYALGRPWQNEPRAYFLNTVMVAKASADGWGGMGTLPTHFYEFNSMDADGNAIDLSTRKNSPTSTNSYVPVLSAEEAAVLTARNVLCGTDSWDPAGESVQLDAPAGVAIKDGVLSWYPVEGATGYVIYKDGEYVAHVDGTTYNVEEAAAAPALRAEADPVYTVHSVNAMGAHGAGKAAVPGVLGIDEVNAAEAAVKVVYYNAMGQAVSADTKGVLIRVSTAADGSSVSEKILVK